MPKPRRPLRVAVWAFLLALAVCGVFGVEAWPLTGFRLFADERHQHSVSWSASMETGGGERPLTFADAAATSGAGSLINRFHDMDRDQQRQTCSAWLHLLASESTVVSRITVNRIDTDLAQRDGNRGAPGEERPAFVCTADGVHAA